MPLLFKNGVESGAVFKKTAGKSELRPRNGAVLKRAWQLKSAATFKTAATKKRSDLIARQPLRDKLKARQLRSAT